MACSGKPDFTCMAIAFQPEPGKKRYDQEVPTHSSESDHYSQVRCVITFEMGTQTEELVTLPMC